MSKIKANYKKESKSSKVIINEKSFKLNKTLLWVVISCIFGYLHMYHIETLFENDKHFSHLSTLERELSFRTESALYYYYFKKLVTSNQSLMETTSKLIMNDNRTEHPTTINSLKRFNLYSELITAFIYRSLDNLKMLKKQCWQIDRGSEMPPVESCVGYLEPIYFYAKSVFILNGLSVIFLFSLCYFINNKSIISGILACVCYFYNHGESTRVMWTPALRENFSFPFCLLQMVYLTVLMQKKNVSMINFTFFIGSTVLYLLTWQFAQFSLASQMLSIFATYSLGYLSRNKLITIIKAHSLSLIICYVLMFANTMLMTSLFASVLGSIWLLLFIDSYILKMYQLNSNRIIIKCFITIVNVLLICFLIFITKEYVLKWTFQVEDDSHIWDILKSKLDNRLHTFDTRLYTCAKEFDFLETETFIKLTKTFLLPFALINFGFYVCKLIIDYFTEKTCDFDDENQGVIVYNIFQMIAFQLMAYLIMRLKLFWVPHLCIFVSLFGNESSENILSYLFKLINYLKISIFEEKKFKLFMFALILALMSYQGIQNIKQEHDIIGEYSDYTMESVMNWVNKNTKLNDSFAGKY
jgi:C-mannosyltransferase DPY19L